MEKQSLVAYDFMCLLQSGRQSVPWFVGFEQKENRF